MRNAPLDIAKARAAGADLVITGEGRLDEQTLSGKVVAQVAAVARDAGASCYVVSGRLDLESGVASAHGIDAAKALEPGADVEASIERAVRDLVLEFIAGNE